MEFKSFRFFFSLNTPKSLQLIINMSKQSKITPKKMKYSTQTEICLTFLTGEL